MEDENEKTALLIASKNRNTTIVKLLVNAGARINEKDNLRYSGVTVFTTEDIKEKGIESVMDEAFKIAGYKTKGIHISYDLDVIDPDIAPGVSLPKFDGLTEEEAMAINEYIIKHINEVVSFDLVEFNPLRDIERKTEQIALNILAQIIKSVENKKKYSEKDYDNYE